jgi:hypothetical protein
VNKLQVCASIHTSKVQKSAEKMTSRAIDELEFPSSPRKKVKLDNAQENVVVNSNLNLSISKPLEPSTTTTQSSLATNEATMDGHNDQLQKEAEVGITEFISPHLPGFHGVLKKR